MRFRDVVAGRENTTTERSKAVLVLVDEDAGIVVDYN